MNPILKNVLAVLAGIIGGSAVNMGIIMFSGSIIPPPEGIDPTSMESLAENMHLFEAKHFIMPFMAHALGTLVGAMIAAAIAATHKMKLAVGLGIWFLIGGVMNTVMLPAPTWFTVLDLTLAYIPMGLLGGKVLLTLLNKEP